MARLGLSNPFAFTSWPVTIITTLVYIATLTAVIIAQVRVPDLPPASSIPTGINVTQAWNDLQTLTASYHPYNSRNNDQVHKWLLRRISQILKESNATDTSAVVFNNDDNFSFSFPGLSPTLGIYFEGTNIIVYIRGIEDDPTEWYREPRTNPSKSNAVLVNAHYDSVSTAYGSTDDGVGCITALQLIQHYTTAGNQPKNGLVILFNNGEEDFLNGGVVFTQHPMSKLPSAFLNLEGIGAGGKAVLFRSTDAEITRAYAKSPHPYGNVMTQAFFDSKIIRSQTDYITFNTALGLRGLDVLFIDPRSRYHTSEDDSRHTGRKALWNMLSASIATTAEMTTHPLLKTDKVHPAVWFDWFAETMAVVRTKTIFAVSVTLVVVGPILLLCTLVLLNKADKLYLFTSHTKHQTEAGDERVPTRGWEGFFRFPVIFILAAATPSGLAIGVHKMNPYIAHSSEWTLWPMFVSGFVFVAWLLSRIFDLYHPSALTRAYTLTWLCLIGWIMSIASVAYGQKKGWAGVYFVLFYSSCLFVSTWLSYLEMFSLRKRSIYAEMACEDIQQGSPFGSDPQEETEIPEESEDPNPTERSALLSRSWRETYHTQTRVETEPSRPLHEQKPKTTARFGEQVWSQPMWNWMWLIELVLLIPIISILASQNGIYLMAVLRQSDSDGNDYLPVYIIMALTTIFVFTPALPFLHRFTWHLPCLLLLVFIGTFIYNLVMFPFSMDARLKLSWQQQIDLDYGNNSVSLAGLRGFLQDAIETVPSAAGQKLHCIDMPAQGNRQQCFWSGPTPKVALGNPKHKNWNYTQWTNFKATITSNGTENRSAQFVVSGQNTRACKIQFDSPINDFHVLGQGPLDNKRFPPVSATNSTREIRLWSRTWDRKWTVNITWSVQTSRQGLSGRVVCLWSDVNTKGVIPAFDETVQFVPVWVAITKLSDGLVEGYKRFQL